MTAVISATFSANVMADSTLDKVKSTGNMTVAYRESSIPFSYLGDDGRPVGFSWEICRKIVDEVNSLLRNYIDDPYQTIDLNMRIETPLLKNNLHLAEIVRDRCLQHIEFSNIVVLNDGAVFILFVKNA